MAKLTSKERGKMKGREFALPGKRAYPIEDKSHARNALARAAQHASPAEQATIRRKVKAKYPGIAVSREDRAKHDPHQAITEQ
jgi:hypothetical protein